MQRSEGAATPYEAYCHHCRVTCPIGTQTCVHCGGRISGPLLETPFQRRVEMTGEDEDPSALTLRRFGGLAIWVLLALSAVISNLCSR